MRRKIMMDGWRRWVVLTALTLCLGGCDELFPKRTPGEKLYRKHCADCHGVDGSGHTIRSMGDAYANLLDDSWRHPGDAAGMESVIREGLVFDHPTYDKFSHQEVRQIVSHIMKLRGENRK